jgi:hypothetical protein
MYVVIADMSTTSPAARLIPRGVNMGFENDQVFDAVEYFNVCVAYFTAAKKWDPAYHFITIDLHFWEGNTQTRHITL